VSHPTFTPMVVVLIYKLPTTIMRVIQFDDIQRRGIFGQGGQDRERQSRKCEIKVFAGIRAFFCPEKKRSPKKRSFLDLGVFLSQKWLRIQVLGGQKSPRGGAKISPGGATAPLLPARMTIFIIDN